MKAHLTKTYFEVRTKGDGEFDWFSVPSTAECDSIQLYDPQSLESTQKYAKHVGGFVVKITETTIEPVTTL